MKKNDELICNFMDYVRNCDRGNYKKFWYHIPDPKWGIRNKQVFAGFWDNELPFEKSWDYLMPVIKKCYDISLDRNHFWKNVSYQYKFESISHGIVNLGCNPKKTYKYVVEFIKFHNENIK